MPETVRLDRTDAEFVDVIHTDSKSILQLGLGMSQAIGHIDFYPNGFVNRLVIAKILENKNPSFHFLCLTMGLCYPTNCRIIFNDYSRRNLCFKHKNA